LLKRPRVTVATVVFNGAAVLEHAITSVLQWQHDLVEYVVVDGGSKDGTVALLERYDDQIDSWISEPDRGIYDAMNKALKMARGEWVIFLGADDVLLPDFDAAVRHLTDPRAVYYGNVQIEATGAISGGRFSRYRLMQENICHQALFYPREVYQSKPYDIQAGLLADHKYNIELWGSGTRFVHLPMTVSRYNNAGASSGNQHYFDAIKLVAIRTHFGIFYYVLKLARTALVKLIKGRCGSA
jgi:glycosyltransferase involved in cell wall biosynthesis